jgi:DNA polymerase III epsilon subunit-like protein
MSQKIMVLDCEFNQPSRKCIEIGAAVYHARTGECYGSLETYVCPHEPISPEIVELTGITDRKVQNAPNILEAWGMLKDFHQKHKVFRNPIVWGSGIRSDSSALYNEYCTYVCMEDGHDIDQPEDNFMGFRVIDAKTLFQSLMLFENSGYGGGLEASMKRLGLKFEGDKHRALTDARNTFTIWYHLTRLASNGLKAKK